MIVRINGKIIESNKPQAQKVNSGTFTWTTLKKPKTETKANNTTPQSSPAKQQIKETMKERLDKIRKTLRHSLNPAIFSTHLLAGVPIYALANNYNVMSIPEPAATALTANMAVPVVSTTATATAATGTMNMPVLLQPIISMLQDLALPVGIGMAIWGLIELIIGNPGGRDKIKHALLGYVGVFIIPFFFYQIRAGCAALGVPGI